MAELRYFGDDIDGVVAQNCTVHLEQMGPTLWFLAIYDADGARTALWLGAKNSRAAVVVRHAETTGASA
jgi:hypothetical protein